jgi:hypothetical protein
MTKLTVAFHNFAKEPKTGTRFFSSSVNLNSDSKCGKVKLCSNTDDSVCTCTH